MRAVKLIAVSTVAILVGATNFAIAAQGSLQSGSSMHGSSIKKGSVHSSRLGGTPSHRGGTYARATSQEMESLNAQERTRLRDMVHSIPRISNVGTEVRINAFVPRNVRQAAAPLPPQVQKMYPRFRQSRAFMYHDQIVIVNPVTSRIIAIVQA
jgi:hypothetical protein